MLSPLISPTAMANEKGVVADVSEWKVTVDGGLTTDSKLSKASGEWLGTFMRKARDLERRHLRKVLHCLKLGLAVSLVSLSFYVKPLYQGFEGSAIGAILTSMAIFDIQVGGTFYKGFTETTANLLAASLAVAVHLLAVKTGGQAEPIVRGVSVFLLAFATTLARYVQRVRVLFEDGMMTFVIIFILFLVSGYRDDNVVEMAQQRIYAVAIGSSIAILVCMLVCPVWAGNELLLVVTHNVELLASSLEGCVAEYFKGAEMILGKEEPCQGSDGYKCVLESMSHENSLVNLARWEPVHGRFGFRHPWKQYLKVGAEMRNCACLLKTLHGCINSKLEAPEIIKKQLSGVCMRLGTNSSKILNELSVIMNSTRKSQSIDFLVSEMNFAAEELQATLMSLPNQAATTDIDTPLIEVVSLVTFSEILIENSTRIKVLVEIVGELAHLARFKPPKTDKKYKQMVEQSLS